MEIICRITEQHPLETKEYADRDGALQTVKTVKMDLQSASATFQAEAVGPLAERLSAHPLDPNYYYQAGIRMRLDHVTTKDGKQFDTTRITLISIDLL